MIKELIHILSKSEQKTFKSWLQQRNKRKEDTAVYLFDQLEKGREDLARKRLGTNAYNVTKKRLTDRLLEFMGNGAMEQEAGEEVDAIKLLVLSRKLFAHDHVKLAQRTLSKAEAMATNLRHYGLLNEIYHTAIHFSYLPEGDNQEELFQRAQANMNAFQREMQINMAHARIRSIFVASEFNKDTPSHQLKAEIESIYARFDLKEDDIHSFQTLYQLVQIADISAFHQKNYYLIDLYFAERIDALSGTPLDGEKTLIYHIDVLYLVANIYFRQRDFEKSMRYLDRMQDQMQRYDGRFQKARLPQYSTLRALNTNFLGHPEEALSLIDALIDSEFPRETLLPAMLTRAMILFQQNEIAAANKSLSSLQHTDKWYRERVGLDWLLNRRYMEILLHIELGNTDYAESRMLSLIRKYGDLFQESRENPALPFLQLMRKYNNNPLEVRSPEFRSTVEYTIPWRRNGEEDIFLMCFYAWLKAKMEGRALYETTLELVRMSPYHLNK